ncbi:MAG: hypothetical protein ABIE22_05120 [archaeon]
MMDIVPVEYDDVQWIKEGSLYRGHSQGVFEERVVHSVYQGQEPAYWGTKNGDGTKLTFGSPLLSECLSHARSFIEGFPKIAEERYKAFTHFPIILEINARPYKDNLFRSVAGEGYIIKDPISLNDIEVLYCLEFDKLKQACPDSKFLKVIEVQLRLIKGTMKETGFKKQSLLGNLQKNKAKTISEIMRNLRGGQMILGGGLNGGLYVDPKVERAIEILEQKLAA